MKNASITKNMTTGNVPILFAPSHKYRLFETEMASACKITNVKPLARAMVARVIMKALNFSLPTKNPFIAPINAPAKIAPKKPRNELPVYVSNTTPTAPENATLEPTDKSIPPVIMINVMPMLSKNNTEMLRKRIPIFVNEKKIGFVK